MSGILRTPVRSEEHRGLPLHVCNILQKPLLLRLLYPATPSAYPGEAGSKLTAIKAQADRDATQAAITASQPVGAASMLHRPLLPRDCLGV